MAVYEIDIMAELAREVGDTDSSNLYYSSNEIFSALNDGLKDYNRNMPQQFAVIGTGNQAYYSPDPNEEQKRLIVLYSARVLLKGELSKQARQAIAHSNPTGKTDLTQRPQWTHMALKDKDKEINYLKRQIEEALVRQELYDGKGAKELRSNSEINHAEGLRITEINETV